MRQKNALCNNIHGGMLISSLITKLLLMNQLSSKYFLLTNLSIMLSKYPRDQVQKDQVRWNGTLTLTDL